MALSWIYKLKVKLTEVKVPLESIVYFFSKNPSSMSFRKARDSSLHDDWKSNSKKHLEQLFFDSFPRNEQNFYHFLCSKTWSLHVRAQLRISITELAELPSLIHRQFKISLSC